MRLRPLLVLVLLALPLASLQAAAQGGATMTITVTGPASATVNAGGTHSASFDVNVVISGVQCASPGTVEIGVALSNAGAAPAGVTPTVDPANITIDIPPGIHGAPVPGLPVGTPVNATATATLRIATTAAAGGTYPATIAASWAGGSAGQGCVGDIPAAQGSANHQLTIVPQQTGNGTSPSPSPNPGPGGNNTGNNTSQPPPPRGLPGFESLALAGAAVLVAVVARRRRA